MSFGIYIAGFLILISGLIYGRRYPAYAAALDRRAIRN